MVLIENQEVEGKELKDISIVNVRNVLKQLMQANEELACREQQVEEARAARDVAEQTVEDLRVALCRLVIACGGSVALPGMQRPLYVKTIRNFDYEPDQLLPWLKRHAPRYIRESASIAVDRRRLKKDLSLRGGRALLPGAPGVVAGVRVSIEQQIVIPRPGGVESCNAEEKSNG